MWEVNGVGADLSVEYISVVVDVVGQQVGLRAHQQGVPCGVRPQGACGQAADRLVDVEQGDVRVLCALAQPVGHGALPAGVGVVDEHLVEKGDEQVGGRWKVSYVCFFYFKRRDIKKWKFIALIIR